MNGDQGIMRSGDQLEWVKRTASVHGFNGSRFRVERRTESIIVRNSHERVELLAPPMFFAPRDTGSAKMQFGSTVWFLFNKCFSSSNFEPVNRYKGVPRV